MFKKVAFDCELCMARFCRKPPFDAHLEKSHFESVPGIKILCCEKCDFKTGHNPAYQKHVKGLPCKPERKFLKCEFCDQLLTVETNRKQHVKIFHADKLEGKAVVYTCTVCGYKVADDSYFYEHKFKCVVKKKAADNAALIKVGYNKRLEGVNDDAFECDKCGAKFGEEDTYGNHTNACCQITKSSESVQNAKPNTVKLVFGQYK